MKIIHGINNIPRITRGVIAMGVFDGVHLAHARILDAAVRQARKAQGEAIVLTFSPHPQNEESLYSLEHRLRLIARYGIKYCVVLNFNRRFSKIPADVFVKKILVGKLKAKYVFIGKNFRFGAHASGDFSLLRKIAGIYGFKVKGFNIIKAKGKPISSTLIRSMIKCGKLAEAEALLGRPVTVLGTVIKGSSVARRLGYPTANIDPHHEVIPPPGIYAVNVFYHKNKFKGVCYIGTKPTFRGKKNRVHVEAHIFNFGKNIYGDFLDIEFIERIRSDRLFKSPKLLALAIEKDILQAKRILTRH